MSAVGRFHCNVYLKMVDCLISQKASLKFTSLKPRNKKGRQKGLKLVKQKSFPLSDF